MECTRTEAQALYSSRTYSNTNWFSFQGWSGWARLVDAHDGDTVTVVMYVQGQYIKCRLRLAGINAPEINSKDPVIKEGAVVARNRILQLACESEAACGLNELLSRAEIHTLLDKECVLVWIRCLQMDKYGRILAHVYPSSNHDKSINAMLVEEKRAEPFMVDA